VTLLLFKIQREYWSSLKSFLIFLNMIRDDELTNIQHDTFVLDRLKEL